MKKPGKNFGTAARGVMMTLAMGAALLPATPRLSATTQSHSRGAESLLSAGKVDEAIGVLRQQTQAAPQDARAHHLLCHAFLDIRKWDAAISECQTAVNMDPGVSAYHMWLGRAYGEKAEHSSFISAAGLAKRSRMEFEHAVQLDSSNFDARSDLAEFYIEAPGFLGGGKEKAQAQAEAIAPHDMATSHWIHARIAEHEKNLTGAEMEYKAAIRASGNHGDRWIDLASFYRRQGRLSEMEEAVNNAIQADRKKSNLFFDAAALLVRAGRNIPAATQFITRYLSSSDKVEEAPAFQAHYLLGSILETQGNKKAAAAEYQKALALAKDFDDAQKALKRIKY